MTINFSISKDIDIKQLEEFGLLRQESIHVYSLVINKVNYI